MPASLRIYDWKAAVATVALALTAIGGAFAALWGLIAGLWTFSTREFGSFAIVLAVTTILVAVPLLSFRAISRAKHRLALVISIPALVIYAYGILIILSR